jgi:hypothetical protein
MLKWPGKRKFKNRQRTLKKYWFNIEDDKKDKISRVGVPLNILGTQFSAFIQVPLLPTVGKKNMCQHYSVGLDRIRSTPF